MAFSYKVGSITSPASTGNQATTGVGFQPKIVLFFANPATADGANGFSRNFFGAGVSSSSRFAIDENNNNDTATHTASKCFVVTGAGSVTIDADLVSLDADGFTVNWTTVSSGMIVQYVALGGADLSNVAIKQFTSPTSTGNQATSGVGFQPDAVIFASIGQSTAPPNLFSADVPFALGAMTSTGQGTAVRDFDAGGQRSYQRTNAALATVVNAAKQLEASYVSLDADGFTLNFTTVDASARYIWAICLKGGQYKVGSFDKPTATGNAGTTGVGFTPVGEFFWSYGVASSTTIADNGGRYSVGFASSSSNRGTWATSATGASRANLDRTVALRMENSGTTTGVADFVSQDADGFTLNWTTADATARQILYMAFGSAAATNAFMPGTGDPNLSLHNSMAN